MSTSTTRERVALVVAGAAAGGAVVFYVTSRLTKLSSAGGKGISQGRSTAASGVAPGGGAAVYESSRAVQEYLAFHFLPPKVLMPYACGPKEGLQFTRRCAELCKKNAGSTVYALDMGCAVGGTAFELTRHFDQVLGVDFSQAFVDAANFMKEKRSVNISIQTEGTLMQEKQVFLPSGIHPERARFMVGDACDMPESFGPFDVVFCGNLLCRLPDPMLFLNRLPFIVKPGGIVLLVSPYSWLTEYTPQDKWLGGKTVNNDVVYSAPTLMRVMKGLGLELVDEQDVPFMIREHARKYQWGCSHATVWRRPKASGLKG